MKKLRVVETGLNNVMLPILLIVVNNIQQVVEPESSLQSGVTTLNNIFDNIEQCGQHSYRRATRSDAIFVTPHVSSWI